MIKVTIQAYCKSLDVMVPIQTPSFRLNGFEIGTLAQCFISLIDGPHRVQCKKKAD